MPPRKPSAQEEHRQSVAAYVAAGGEETVQRVITAVQSLNRKLDQWYARQLADLDVTAGEWGVVTALVKAKEPLTPSQLADLGKVAPASMSHRLDKLAQRGLIERSQDPGNRTRVFVSLTEEGRQLFNLAIQGSSIVETDVLQDLSSPEMKDLARLLEVVIARLDDIEA